MTYVELIVVLSIFSVLSSVSIFNFSTFQDKVDIKNLGSDIALKIVEAQKASLSGNLSTHIPIVGWKPSYGVYFSTASDNLADRKSFIYFADLDNSTTLNDIICYPYDSTGECLDKIEITKNSSISSLDVFSGPTTYDQVQRLTINFTRPNSGAIFHGDDGALLSNVYYARITVISAKFHTVFINIYPSGRIEVK